ncbi:hypothetical protein VNO77_23939 [Canavalia gladiata]|uniref:Uncharacterized protein n=1 Tax=Canavalia gladiata TaxID=3824 RepID=A0AAN9L5B1_CANGL
MITALWFYRKGLGAVKRFLSLDICSHALVKPCVWECGEADPWQALALVQRMTLMAGTCMYEYSSGPEQEVIRNAIIK